MIFYTFTDENSSAAVQHETAHRLLDTALKRLYGIEKYTLVKNKHGKPYIENYPDIFFNLSHCKGLAVCGISNHEIGVDAELIRPYSGKVADRIFTEEEIRFLEESENKDENFFRIWTLKEALGKFLGTGIFSDMKKYEFKIKDGAPVCEAVPENIFTQKILCGKWILSVCGLYEKYSGNDFERVDF